MEQLTNPQSLDKRDKRTCSIRVYNRSRFNSTHCSHSAVVEYDRLYRVLENVETGELDLGFAPIMARQEVEKTEKFRFCRIHSPVYKQAKDAKERAARETEKALKYKVNEGVAALIARLGCGRAQYSQRDGVATGSIILYSSDVDKLLKELGR